MPEQIADYYIYINNLYYTKHYIEFDRALLNLQNFKITKSARQNNAYMIHQVNPDRIINQFHNLESNVQLFIQNQTTNLDNQPSSPQQIIANIIANTIPAGTTLWVVQNEQQNIIEKYVVPEIRLYSNGIIESIKETTNNPPIPLRYRLPIYRWWKLHKIIKSLESQDYHQVNYTIGFIDDYLGIRIIKLYNIATNQHLIIYCRQQKPAWIQEKLLNFINTQIQDKNNGVIKFAHGCYTTDNWQSLSQITQLFQDRQTTATIVTNIKSNHKYETGSHTADTKIILKKGASSPHAGIY